MADLIDRPLKLLRLAYEAVEDVPLSLLLLGVVTTLLATIAFVSPLSPLLFAETDTIRSMALSS
jgi:hypothetical protein